MLRLCNLLIDALSFAYIFALISAPELITSSLTNSLSCALDKNLEKRGAIRDRGFCQNVDKVTRAFEQLSEVICTVHTCTVKISLLQQVLSSLIAPIRCSAAACSS